MPIPSDIQSLIERLNQELDNIEQQATDGLNILRRVMSQFPGNIILVQYFAYLNTLRFFSDTSRRQIETIIETISPDDVPTEVIQESGEDLGTLLGQVIEARRQVQQIFNFLEGLP